MDILLPCYLSLWEPNKLDKLNLISFASVKALFNVLQNMILWSISLLKNLQVRKFTLSSLMSCLFRKYGYYLGYGLSLAIK